METFKIVPFDIKYAQTFKELNIEWLKTFFVVEPHDEVLLDKCKETIIDKGGHIFFIKINNEVVGTLAFIKINEHCFELGKMAVNNSYRGKKIGQELLKYAIAFAKEQAWKELQLYSNTKLENAIHIYKKFGFQEIPLEKDVPYKRSNIKMKLQL